MITHKILNDTYFLMSANEFLFFIVLAIMATVGLTFVFLLALKSTAAKREYESKLDINQRKLLDKYKRFI